jgi:hypothetical protein
MLEMEVRGFVRDQGGVVGVTELARFLEVDEGWVRRYARDRGLRRVGATFVFSEDSGAELARYLEDEEDEDGDDDGEADVNGEDDGKDEVDDEGEDAVQDEEAEPAEGCGSPRRSR